eukprot:363145-Chlamydomonas_euryale.AAC.4
MGLRGATAVCRLGLVPSRQSCAGQAYMRGMIKQAGVRAWDEHTEQAVRLCVSTYPLRQRWQRQQCFDHLLADERHTWLPVAGVSLLAVLHAAAAGWRAAAAAAAAAWPQRHRQFSDVSIASPQAAEPSLSHA